jgi:hypothetical protein
MSPLYNEKVRDYSNLRLYSAIIVDAGSAAMIVGGAITNDIGLIAVGGSIGFSSIFYSIDVAMEQARIRKEKKKDLEGMAQNRTSDNI